MKKYLIEAEVPGNISDSIFIDRTVRPRIVEKLVYIFDGWLGDDLIESIGTYIVSERLMKGIRENNLTGCSFEKAEVIKSEQFIKIYGDKELPVFYWMKLGNSDNEDLSIKNCSLMTSEKAFTVLQKFNLKNGTIEEIIT